MAARVILRIVRLMRRALSMKAVAQSVEKIARVAGRIRAIHRCCRVITIFSSMAGELIGTDMVVVMMLVGIVSEHGGRTEAHKTGCCEEEQKAASTNVFICGVRRSAR